MLSMRGHPQLLVPLKLSRKKTAPALEFGALWGHALQEAAPEITSLYLPLRQLVHAVCFFQLYLPWLHAEQVSWPGASLYRPAAHATHVVVEELNLPFGQLVHAACFFRLYLP